MRAWAVDLAGNPPARAEPAARARRARSRERSATAARRSRAERRRRRPAAAGLRAGDARGPRVARQSATPRPPAAATAAVRRRRSTRRVVRARLGRAALASRAPIAARPSLSTAMPLVAQAVAAAVADREQPFVAETPRAPPTRSRRSIASHARERLRPAAWLDAVARALATVTPLAAVPALGPGAEPGGRPAAALHRGRVAARPRRPLRRHPGPRHAGDHGHAAATAYAAAASRLDLGYGASSERHLAPPKTSQVQAELHGMFDDGDRLDRPGRPPAAARRGAARERHVPRPRRRRHRRPARPDRRSRASGSRRSPARRRPTRSRCRCSGPATRRHPGRATTSRRASTSSTTRPTSCSRTCPTRSRAASRSCSRRPASTARSRSRSAPRGSPPRYPGNWPEVSRSGWCSTAPTSSAGKVDGRVITISLPAGDVQRFRLASSLDRDRARPVRALAQPAAVGAATTGRRRGGGRRLAVGADPVRGRDARPRRPPPARGAASDELMPVAHRRARRA